MQEGRRTVSDNTKILKMYNDQFCISYFPVYMCQHKAKLDGKTYEISDFYRSKEASADVKIGQAPEILRKVEPCHNLDIFWALEPESMPSIIQRLKEEQKKRTA